MEPTAGLMVTNNLRLVEMLGAGGMGSVWIAEHLGLETTVAVKFITTDLALKNPTLVTRFKREAGVAAKIKSPHVVQIFDHGLTEDGTPYIAMELLEGESLEDRLERGKLLNLRETGLVIAQTCQVLAKAHGMGIVHRDIKPANLYLMDSAYDLFIKVLDFGIAKHTDTMKQVSVTSTGSMIGSPLYMSPEQFTSAKGVDARADLWSLAVVAYHMLTGRPSFGGETIGQVMMAVMSSDYLPPQVHRPDLPVGFDDWFHKAFAKDINQRFQSAEELASSFQVIITTAAEQGGDVAMTRTPEPQAASAMNASHVSPSGQVGAGTGDPAEELAKIPTAGGQGTLEPTAATMDPVDSSGAGVSAGGLDPAVAVQVPKKPVGAFIAIVGVMLAAAVGVAAYFTLGSSPPEPAATESAQEAPTDEAQANEAEDEASADAPSDEPAASATASGDEAPTAPDDSAEPADSGPVAAKPPRPGVQPTSGSVPKPPRTTAPPKPTPPKTTSGGDEKYGF